MGIVVTNEVDKLLASTSVGAEALRVVSTNSLEVSFETSGRPAAFIIDDKTGKKKIVVNKNMPVQEIAYYFVHEAHHARQSLGGASGDASKQAREEFVETMVSEESLGTALGFEFIVELKRGGGTPTKPLPFRFEMYEDFVTRKRKSLTEDHKDWSQQKIDQSVIAWGRKFVRAMVNDGALRPDALHSYAEYYAHEWAVARSKSGGP